MRRFVALFGGLLAVAGLYFPGETAQAGAQAAAATTTTTTPAASATAPGPPWQAVPSSSPFGLASNELYGVACPAGGTCTAAGHAAVEAGQPALVETLGNDGWQLSSGPAAPGAAYNRLSSISCPAPGSCVAVGWQQGPGGLVQTLVETLSSKTWRVVQSPNAGNGDNYLTGVFCMSATSCVAVGYYSSGKTDKALAEVLSGGTWQLSSAPDKGTGNNYLSSVSCPAGNLCFAVGYYQGPAGHYQALAEAWSAGAWSMRAAGNIGSDDNALYGIGCASPSACIAVGSYFNGHAYQVLAESLSAGVWVPRTNMPDASVANNQLSGVWCTSANNCVAVGWYSNGQARQSLVEQLSSGRWRIARAPEQGSGDNVLSAVSCSSPSSCAAVGDFASGGEHVALSLVRKSGSWHLTPAAPLSAPVDHLDAVSCTAASSCTGAGSYVDGSGVTQALVELLANGTWVLSPVPNPSPPGARLEGLSCTGVGSCVAVGWQGTSSQPQARLFAETLAGGSWAVAPVPGPAGSPGGELASVSCPAGGGCVAVGWAFNGRSNEPLIEAQVNGGWTVVPAPALAGPGQLDGVSCSSSGDCVAVGWYTSHGTDEPLVEQLAGGSWQQVGVPGHGRLRAVSCPTNGGGSCVAVGSSDSGSSVQTLVEMLADGTWSLVLSPNPGAAGDALQGVSCISASSCVAVGSQLAAPQAGGQPLVEMLSNGAWSTASSTVGAGLFAGVDCVPASSACAAVGWSMDGEADLALAASGQAPASLPVATTVTLSSAPNPSLVRHRVTYSAVVKPAPGAGTVSFIQDGALLRRCRSVPVDQGGTATCSLTYVSTGSHVVQASFSGSTGFNPSVSLPYSQVVTKPAPPPQGYWLATRDGAVFAGGAAPELGGTSTAHSGSVVGIAATRDGRGYWLVSSNGAVAAFGDAHFFGDLPVLHIKVHDIVAMAPTPTGRGYWLVGRDGGFFAFGGARFHGSLPAEHVKVHDIVGMVTSAGGRGYVLVGRDGGVFTFGSAHFYGSLPASKVHVKDIRAIFSPPGGRGYVLVGRDGGAFVFGGGTRFYGSLPGRHIKVKDIVGIALTSDDEGYLMAGANGAVYGFGDAKVGPIPAGLGSHLPVVAVAET